MNQIEYKPTTSRLFQSRIIKFALIGIAVVLAVDLVAKALILWISWKLSAGGFSGVDESIILKILEVLDVKSIGAVGTITTTVIARYAVRESTGNIAAGLSAGKEADK